MQRLEEAVAQGQEVLLSDDAVGILRRKLTQSRWSSIFVPDSVLLILMFVGGQERLRAAAMSHVVRDTSTKLAVLFRFIERRRRRPVAPLELEGKGSIAQSCDALSGRLVRNESTPCPAEKLYARPETLGAGRS